MKAGEQAARMLHRSPARPRTTRGRRVWPSPRRASGRALQRAKEELDRERRLLEAIDAIVWTADPRTQRITFVTEAAARLGYPVGEWLEEGFLPAHLHGAEAPRMLDAVAAVASDGTPRQRIHRMIAAGGREVWFRTRVTAIRDPDGTIRELAGMMIDITERLAAEVALSRNEARLRIVFEQLPAVVWTTDTQLRFTSAMGRSLATLGGRPDQFVGVPIGEYFQIDGREHPYVAAHLRALAGQATEMDAPWLGRTYRAHLEPFRDADGRIVGTIGIALDVTDRAAAEGALRLLDDASAALAESIDYDATLAKVARLAVPRLADWCVVGVREEGVLRRVAAAHVDPSKEPLFDALPRDLSIEGLGAEGTALLGGRPMLLPVVTDEVLTPEGESPLATTPQDALLAAGFHELGLGSFIAVPLVARGRTLGVMALARVRRERPYGQRDLEVARDLGRRCAMAIDNALLHRAAQQAIQTRDEFLSVASHELRTPLTSALLRAQQIRRSVQLGTTVGERETRAFELVERQLVRLSALVEQLLDVSRMRLGKLVLVPEEVDLVEVVRDVAARLERDVGAAGCTLSISAPPRLVGWWDRLRVEQIVTNLLSNAIKFGAGHPVEVTIAGDDESAQLAVRDHGIGIDPEHQARIFERFERAVSPRAFTGLGLGLYITRQIVEAHGGRIRLESQVGRGSTFTVVLPRRGGAPPGAAAARVAG